MDSMYAANAPDLNPCPRADVDHVEALWLHPRVLTGAACEDRDLAGSAAPGVLPERSVNDLLRVHHPARNVNDYDLPSPRSRHFKEGDLVTRRRKNHFVHDCAVRAIDLPVSARSRIAHHDPVPRATSAAILHAYEEGNGILRVHSVDLR